MLKRFKDWFSKGQIDESLSKSTSSEGFFFLKVDDLNLATLKCKNGEWIFRYTEEFKERQDEYNRIIGFPDIDKIYICEHLWPFFRTRIPGLKQPAVIEILEKEKIDKENEVELLKRFGKKTISNPYELEFA